MRNSSVRLSTDQISDISATNRVHTIKVGEWDGKCIEEMLDATWREMTLMEPHVRMGIEIMTTNAKFGVPI